MKKRKPNSNLFTVNEMAQELDLGQETLKDIIADLLKPGRDLRDSF